MQARYSRALLHSQLGLWNPAPRPSFLCRCPQRADLDLLIAPQLSRQVLEYTLVNERVTSLQLRVGESFSCDFNLWAEWVCRVPGLLGMPGRGAG